MLLFLILYVNTLALILVQKRFFARDLTEGTSFFLGTCCLTIIPFILGTWCALELHLVAKVLFSASLLAGLYSLITGYKEMDFNWKHPIYIFPLAVVLILLCFGETQYVIQLGDETSHWMLIPKQMFSFQKFGSNDFYFRPFMSYTPGWTFLKSYPSLLLYKFGVDEFMWRGVTYLSLFYFFSLLFLIYDIFCSYRFSFLPKKYISLTGNLLILALICLRPFGRVFSTHIAIELPLNFTYVACLIMIWATSVGIFSLKRGFLFLGILITHAYLLKTPAALLLLPSLIALFALCYKHKQTKGNTLKYFLSMSLGFIVVYFTWKNYISDFPVLFNDTTGAWLKIQKHAYLIKGMLANLTHFFIFRLDTTNYHLIYKFFNTIALLFLAYKVLRKKDLIVISSGLILFLGYFLGLYYMYMVSFGATEGTALASFSRYMSSAIAPNRSLALLLMVFFILDNQRFCKLWISLLNNRMRVFAMFTVLLVGIGYQAHKVYYSPAHARAPHPTILNARKLVEVLRIHNMLGAEVRIVAQGQANQSWLAANYISISSKPGVDRHFTPLIDISWPLDSSLKTQNKSKVQITKELLSSDVLWVEVSDNKMNKLLREILDTSGCPEPFEHYFFLKREDGSFFCVKK
jgi:hypothetical protein